MLAAGALPDLEHRLAMWEGERREFVLELSDGTDQSFRLGIRPTYPGLLVGPGKAVAEVHFVNSCFETSMQFVIDPSCWSLLAEGLSEALAD